MAQTVTGFKSILSHPWVYALSQNLIGCRKERREIVRSYIRPQAGDRILDIGCGTADILEFLPDVEYLGCDLSQRYIDAAEKRFGHRATFRCQAVTAATLEDMQPFELVISLGVLHHLDDDEAAGLFELAHAALRPGGRLITLDPTFVEGQSALAKLAIRSDRGHNVRTPDQYRALAMRVFPEVRLTVRHDLLSIPYTRAILETVQPTCVRS